MVAKFETTDYYEMVALFRAIQVVKFDRDPLAPELVGSTFIANIANRLAKALDEMELERGHPERANWQGPIVQDGEKWQIIVREAARHPEIWARQSHEWKADYAHILMSPFSYTVEMLEEFIRQVDELATEFIRQRDEGALDQ